MGNPDTRRWEFEAVRHSVKRNKQAFIDRLNRRLTPHGECLIHNGAQDGRGYARMNFWYKGRQQMIGVHRVILILKLAKPIPRGIEAGHTAKCISTCCVRHVEAQSYKENASASAKNTNAKKRRRVEQPCPF